MLLYQILALNTWKNIKRSYKNSKFKLSAPTWNKKFELHNGWYCVSDIQDILSISSKTWKSDWQSSNKNIRKSNRNKNKKTLNSEFSYVEVWFTDQNSKSLEIKDRINITLVIN